MIEYGAQKAYATQLEHSSESRTSLDIGYIGRRSDLKASQINAGCGIEQVTACSSCRDWWRSWSGETNLELWNSWRTQFLAMFFLASACYGDGSFFGRPIILSGPIRLAAKPVWTKLQFKLGAD